MGRTASTEPQCLYKGAIFTRCASRTVLWLRQLVASLTPRKSSWFNLRSVNVRFVVDRMGNGTGFSHITSVFPYHYSFANAAYALIDLSQTLYSLIFATRSVIK